MKMKKKIVAIVLVLILSMGKGHGVINATMVYAQGVNNGNGTFSISVSTSLTGAVSVSANGTTSKFWCEGGSCTIQAGSTTIQGSGTVQIVAIPTNPMDDGNGNKVDAQGGTSSVVVTSKAPAPSGGGDSGDVHPQPTPSKPAQNPSPNNAVNNTTIAKEEEQNAAKKEKDADDKDKKETDQNHPSMLRDLSVTKGKLSPAFSSTTTKYDVYLPPDTTTIAIQASPNDPTSKVDGVGTMNLHTGDNKLIVKCIAKDGSETLYTIIAHVSEKPVTTLQYHGTTLGVLDKAGPISKLFSETKVNINGQVVKAWRNDTLGITLLYMQNEKTHRKDFYMYDVEKGEVTSIYRPFTFDHKNLVMIDVPEKLQKREGMVFTTIRLGNNDLPGWKFSDAAFKNYALIYVMDEAGNTKYYQYEKSEKSLQVFSQAAAITQQTYDAMRTKIKRIGILCIGVMGGMALILLCLLIALIIILIKRKKYSKYKKISVTNTALGAEAKALLQDDHHPHQ